MSRAILYVHGLGCSSSDFDDTAAQPALRGFHTVAFNHPGCGGSAYPNRTDIDGLVELLERRVDASDLSRFLLVGGSLGGLVGLMFAERNRHRLSGFVNVEGNLAPEDCMFSRRVVGHSFEEFETCVFPAIKRDLAGKTGRGFERHLAVLERADPKAYYDYSFKTVEYSDSGTLVDRFLSLDVPIAFVYGSANRGLSYLPRLRASQCEVVEVPDADHFLFYDNPEAFAAVLAAFAENGARW